MAALGAAAMPAAAHPIVAHPLAARRVLARPAAPDTAAPDAAAPDAAGDPRAALHSHDGDAARPGDAGEEPSASRDDSPDHDLHLARGRALVDAGRLAEAIVELEAAARLAPRPAPILSGLARLYLDPRIRRPADALRTARAAARLEPWREEAYWLQARAQEGLGDQAAARRAFAGLLASFPSGRYATPAREALDGLERSHYEVVLEFRFENRGDRPAERIHFQVQAAQDFPPYSQARLLELPDGAVARQLADGTRYFSLTPFALAPRDSRAVRLRYAVAVSAGSFGASDSPAALDGDGRFLESSRFIESDAPEIRSLADALAASGTERERARRLYDFVVRRLSYVVQRETVGALGALANPQQADCTEFAALFVALSRAAGIPARPVFGYLHDPSRETYDISHLWAEFWQEGRGWVSVDPTNGTLEPDRYFARLESNSIPLWVPSPAFGDLAGVRVSYRSKGEGDPLFTELVATIRRIPEPAFVTAAPLDVAFAPSDSESLAPAEAELPVAPAAAVFAAALLIRTWHRRGRAA